MRVLKVVFPLIFVFFSANLLAADSCPYLSGEYRCKSVLGYEIAYNISIDQWSSGRDTAYTLSYDIEYYDIIETVRVITDGVKRDSRGRVAWAHCLGGVLVKHFTNTSEKEVESGVYFMDDNDNLNAVISVYADSGSRLDHKISLSCSRI